MSDRSRFRGQDLYDEYYDDDTSAMQQDQGGRVPDRETGLDYAYTPGWEEHPTATAATPPPRTEEGTIREPGPSDPDALDNTDDLGDLDDPDETADPDALEDDPDNTW